MLVLNVIAGVGLIVGFAIHVLTLLNIFRPTDMVFIIQNVVIGLLLLSLAQIIKKIKHGLEKEAFNKHLLDAMFDTKEVTVFMAFVLSLYGIIAFSLFLFKAFQYAMHSPGSKDVMHMTFFKSLSALLMTFFVVEYLLLYCFKSLRRIYIKRCQCGHANSILATYCESCGVKYGELIHFNLEKPGTDV